MEKKIQGIKVNGTSHMFLTLLNDLTGKTFSLKSEMENIFKNVDLEKEFQSFLKMLNPEDFMVNPPYAGLWVNYHKVVDFAKKMEVKKAMAPVPDSVSEEENQKNADSSEKKLNNATSKYEMIILTNQKDFSVRAFKDLESGECYIAIVDIGKSLDVSNPSAFASQFFQEEDVFFINYNGGKKLRVASTRSFLTACFKIKESRSKLEKIEEFENWVKSSVFSIFTVSKTTHEEKHETEFDFLKYARVKINEKEYKFKVFLGLTYGRFFINRADYLKITGYSRSSGLSKKLPSGISFRYNGKKKIAMYSFEDIEYLCDNSDENHRERSIEFYLFFKDYIKNINVAKEHVQMNENPALTVDSKPSISGTGLVSEPSSKSLSFVEEKREKDVEEERICNQQIAVIAKKYGTNPKRIYTILETEGIICKDRPKNGGVFLSNKYWHYGLVYPKCPNYIIKGKPRILIEEWTPKGALVIYKALAKYGMYPKYQKNKAIKNRKSQLALQKIS